MLQSAPIGKLHQAGVGKNLGKEGICNCAVVWDQWLWQIDIVSTAVMSSSIVADNGSQASSTGQLGMQALGEGSGYGLPDIRMLLDPLEFLLCQSWKRNLWSRCVTILFYIFARKCTYHL
ncbi:uncharacterized protein LOC114271898 [Camellia sinensis]|uniref:uncharacterized protein LOC114271898 n=1 Tax=Camellia sinensis TaxID=4442 RepID=UPI00103569DC|nr:uncharacterized protein LOC114271898 [Camellia sinensis]